MALRTTRHVLLALTAIVGAALLVASVGSGASGQHKRGGTLKLISAGDTDSVDPGRTYYSFGMADPELGQSDAVRDPGELAEDRARPRRRAAEDLRRR